MLAALEEHLGIVSSAAKVVGIARSTHYNWLDSDEVYKQAVSDISEASLDFAESILFQLMKDKDTTAVIFYLKTKAKKRGYVERQEIAADVNLNKNPSWFDNLPANMETKTA